MMEACSCIGRGITKTYAIYAIYYYYYIITIFYAKGNNILSKQVHKHSVFLLSPPLMRSICAAPCLCEEEQRCLGTGLVIQLG